MSTPTFPTSGATAFNLDLASLVEEAFERCGTESRSGYDMRTARRSLALMLLEWANRGINMWTIDGPYSIVLVPGTSTYLLPVDTVDLMDHVIRTNAGSISNQTDLNISRISEPTYMTIPNKLTQGRPIQVWINRQITPQITVWPIPDSSQTWTFVYYRLRRIQDPGTGINGQDIPFRFLPVLCSGLAYYLSVKIPDAQMRIPMLKSMYDEDWRNASEEDREKAPIRLVPRQSFIGGG